MSVDSVVLALLVMCTAALPTPASQVCRGSNKATCLASGCCRWRAHFGCRATIRRHMWCDPSSTPQPALAYSVQQAQAQDAEAKPLTTVRSDTNSSEYDWLWGLIFLLAVCFFCCSLGICAQQVAKIGEKAKRKRVERLKRDDLFVPTAGSHVSAATANSTYEDQMHLLPMTPPLLEPSLMVPTSTPMLQTVAPQTGLAIPMMDGLTVARASPAIVERQAISGYVAQTQPALGFRMQAMPGFR